MKRLLLPASSHRIRIIVILSAEKRKRRKLMNKTYITLLIVTILITLGGLLTLMPWPAASYQNVFGYRSLCTFAPASALFCFLIAGTCCSIRATFFKPQGGTTGERFRRHAKRLIPLVVVLVLAIASTFWFQSVKRYYIDATTLASPEDE